MGVISTLRAAALIAAMIPAAAAADPLATNVEAWDTFCRSNSAPVDLCAKHDIARIKLTDANWRAIVAAWSGARHTLTLTSEARWGDAAADVWRWPSDLVADCEDASIWMIGQLVQAGIPRGALRLRIVEDWSGGWHAVALVDTDKGPLELDILARTLRRDMAGQESNPVLTQYPGYPSVWMHHWRVVHAPSD